MECQDSRSRLRKNSDIHVWVYFDNCLQGVHFRLIELENASIFEINRGGRGKRNGKRMVSRDYGLFLD